MRKLALGAAFTLAICLGYALAQDDPATWPDALVAAPDSHDVLYEDDNVRILSVTVNPGERGAEHGHRWPSVLIVDSVAASVDHLPDGSTMQWGRLGPEDTYPQVLTFGPEAPHSWENVDTIPYHLYRMEFKAIEFRNLR